MTQDDHATELRSAAADMKQDKSTATASDHVAPPLFEIPAGSQGALLRLRSRAGAGGNCVMGRWKVSVAPGSEFLLLVTDEQNHSWEQVIDKAEKFLDILSVTAGQSYELAKLDSTSERFMWRSDEKGVRLEIQVFWPIRAPLTLLTRHVGDGPASEDHPSPSYHLGMRYFRCSQVAGNPGLAFQYLFLALEALLAARQPKPRDKRELEWLRDALAVEAKTYFTVAREAVLARGGASNDIEHIYRVRLALFHAKPDREPLVPLEPVSEPRIKEAYWRLATHVLELLRHWNVWPQGQTLATEKEVNEQGEFIQDLIGAGVVLEKKAITPPFVSRAILATKSDAKMPVFAVEWDCPQGLPTTLRGFTWNFGGIRPIHTLSVIPTTTAPTVMVVRLQTHGGLQHVMS